MSDYDYPEFLRLVRIERNVPCWGCKLWPSETGRCHAQSAGIVDAHHVVAKQWIKQEFPNGAYDYEDGGLDPIPRAQVALMAPDAETHGGVKVVTQARLLMDPRNGVLVRRWHHDQLEAHMRTPAFEDLPAGVVAFAKWVGLLPRLERRYPPAA